MEPPTTSSTRARRIQRNPWIQGLAATPFLFALGALVVGLTVQPQAAFGIIHGVAFGTFASLYAWRRNRWPRFDDVAVEVDDDVIRIGAEVVPRAELTGGVLAPQPDGFVVRLSRKLPKLPLELLVATEEEGSRVLAALGYDVDQAVASFRGMSRIHRSTFEAVAWGLGGVAAMAGLGLGGAAALGPVGSVVGFVFGMVLMMGLQLAPTSIEVGADGVLLRWLGREEWIPHRNIRGVHTTTKGWGRNARTMVVLTLDRGQEVPIPITGANLDHGRAETVASRIRAAKSRAGQGGATDLGALLHRGDRAYDEWVATLRSVAERATHRAAPVAPKRLWRLVEDAQAAPLDRAAAAVALAREANAGPRIAQVAQATADRRLRIALDHADADDEEALVEALASLEQAERVP